MSLSNVLLIWRKELRDQLRDRRTIFMIAVLPLLLYPLLGLSFVQVAQFLREHPSRIAMVGAEGLSSAQLLDGNEVALEYCGSAEKQALLLIETHRSDGQTASDAAKWATKLRSGEIDAVVLFPKGLTEKIRSMTEPLSEPGFSLSEPLLQGVSSAEGELHSQAKREASSKEIAGGRQPDTAPILMHNSAKEKSRIAESRISGVLNRWHQSLVKQRLQRAGLEQDFSLQLQPSLRDVAEKNTKDAALWSKILPFVALIWSLTGAFYPAIDVCAGEKERGTLETLLCSSAKRSEIVWGKLLTVMTFSLATSLLNLAALSCVGTLVIRMFAAQTSAAPAAPPHLAGLLWLVVALLPISALFSALCVSLAAFAKSSKEGQYYLMPLMLVGMPLMMLSMSPGAELNLGASLIPLTGLMLMLRGLFEGELWRVAPYAPPVLAVTLLCCFAALRWAVTQFDREEVLFRESERFNPRLWVAQLFKEREDLPNFTEAMACGLGVLVLQFTMSFLLPAPRGPGDIPAMVLAPQLAVIATPAVLMAVFLSRRPLKTLRLNRAAAWMIPYGVLLAIAVHPLATLFKCVVFQLYPPRAMPGLEMMQNFMTAPNTLPLVLALFALTPAVCEELAFRGFILSGLSSRGSRWPSLLISAAFFAAVHPLVQQAIVAGFLGLLMGWLVMRTRSLWISVAFHATHNALMIMSARWQMNWAEFAGVLKPFSTDLHWYGGPLTAAAGLITFSLLAAAAAWTREEIAKHVEEAPVDVAATGALAGRALLTQ